MVTTVEWTLRHCQYTLVDSGHDHTRSILEKGGTAADAAIAVLFCEGVTIPECMGLGGGFLLTHYQKSTNEVTCLNARETAPENAYEDMYNGNRFASQFGGLAVAVPGELIGYWTLYNRLGRGVPWADILQPSIDLCEKGFPVGGFLAKSLHEERLLGGAVTRELAMNPQTKKIYKEGEIMKRPRLAKTLRIIAKEGGMALHDGVLTNEFVKDVQERGGILTVNDMKNYKPVWVKPVHSTFSNGQSMYSIPVPGSGVVLALILNILDQFLVRGNFYTAINYQRVIESFKFAYGARTKLGDRDTAYMQTVISGMLSKDYARDLRSYIYDKNTFDSIEYYGANTTFEEDHGTAHISVLAPNGDAVAVTSTINGRWGAYFGSLSTGIILNNQMDDFSSPGYQNQYGLPPSPANFIMPGRRPMSSMSPTIILNDKGDVVMIIGAAGGSMITTSVAQIIVKHLWYGVDLKTAMDESRVHHQLMPNDLLIEDKFKIEYEKLLGQIEKIGHNIQFTYQADGFCAVTSISHVNSGNVVGVPDVRRKTAARSAFRNAEDRSHS
ncbi:unnamed protein product [Acanthoscelides obtectus]|uniref:Uncharacterized protein n=1 Tax=Acanthoscelides obtectus TaxID=200917 RepID=A0A9P0LP54_ACAOB|nr:unnamed protein product [Acanthoscelides obtectus]CAK1679869.1 Glutathione hydrolase 1 proenzyme [Acanthoscelides obtectus]